jgi:hypothetical protein
VIVVGRTSASGWVSAPFALVPSDGVFGRLDLAALRGCHTLHVCLFVSFVSKGCPFGLVGYLVSWTVWHLFVWGG